MGGLMVPGAIYKARQWLLHVGSERAGSLTGKMGCCCSSASQIRPGAMTEGNPCPVQVNSTFLLRFRCAATQTSPLLSTGPRLATTKRKPSLLFRQRLVPDAPGIPKLRIVGHFGRSLPRMLAGGEGGFGRAQRHRWDQCPPRVRTRGPGEALPGCAFRFW